MAIDKPYYTAPRENKPGAKVASSYRDDLLYYLSPAYNADQLKDLSDDELKDLLDELADRFSASEGGPVKPLEYLELAQVLNALSEQEKEQIQFMLDKLTKGKK
tara:strand:+ start:406 stop:717 length:312 start_codon:yes stop_codon:yes gene_type:complete